MWVTLDFEASGLSDSSFPIEVGYSLPDGDTTSLLINPLTSSEPWTHWDKYAESAIHGISREELELEGWSVADVCLHLNQTLCQYEHVLCDSQWDLFWMGRLYKAAHMRPAFTLTEIGHWLKYETGISRERFLDCLEALGPPAHRAAADAENIRQAINLLIK